MAKKRALLAALVLAAALLAGCAAKAQSGETVLGAWQRNQPKKAASSTPAIVLRLTHSSGEESIANDAALAMKQRLEAVSGGTMSIDIFAGDSLGSLNDAWNSFGNGTVDMRIGTAGLPQQGTIMWLPLLAEVDREQLQRALVRGQPLRMQIESWSKEKNSLILGMLPVQYRVLASNIPIESRENMRQLTMRTIDSGGDNSYWELLCGKTKEVNVQQLSLALQQKEVNACDNTITNLVEYGTYKQVRYITKLSDRVYFDMILINSQRMAELNERQQQWILDAAAYAEKQISEHQAEYEQKAEKTIEEAGIQVYELSQEEQQSIREATRGTLLERCAEKIGADNLELILQYARQETENTAKE